MLRKTTDAVCTARAPALCPLSQAAAAAADGLSDVGTAAGQCALCEVVVRDLELKSLRHDPRAGPNTPLHSGKVLGGGGVVVAEEVEAVCEELTWRHFEGSVKVDAWCTELVDTHDHALAQHAAAVLHRGTPTPPAGDAAKAVLAQLCGCKEAPAKKKKAINKSKKQTKSDL